MLGERRWSRGSGVMKSRVVLSAVCVLVIAAVCDSGSSNKSAGATTKPVDVAGTCRRARTAAVDAVDALGKVVKNEIGAFNHEAELANAIANKDSAEVVTTAKADLKVHTGSEAMLASRLAAAKSKKKRLVTACRKALAGKKLSVGCESVFTAADHEFGHRTEQLAAVGAARQAMQKAITSLQSNDMTAAEAAGAEAQRQTSAANDLVAPIDEAFKQVDEALAACSGASTTTTTTTIAAGPPSAELQDLANSFGCTGLQTVATKPNATATGSCSYEGQPFLVSTYPASTAAADLRALDYCTPGTMATTAQSPTWLIAPQTQDGGLLVIDIAKKLGTGVTLVMC
jgi:hypothetical protein